MGNSVLFMLLGVGMILAVVAVSPVRDADAMLRGLEEADGADAAERLFLYRSIINSPILDEQTVVLPISDNEVHKRSANDEATGMGKRVYLARVGKRQYYAARIGKK
uniref:Cystatin domain-containing protein n=1 Tax=Panagrellus redivivus TaxID=6233 RepID=A0A7E4W0J5_PANRE